MVSKSDLDTKIARLQALLREKFGVSEAPLPRMLRRTGRRLPKRMHRHANALIEAAGLAENPKLQRQIDGKGLQDGFDRLVAHLEQIDPAARRKDFWLRLTAGIALNLLLVLAALLVWLRWAGHL